MSTFKLPVSICKAIEKNIANFWWRNGKNIAEIHWRKWEKLKLRKNEGGLGFKDLKAFNQAMLGKQAWRISQKPHSLLSKLMKGLYHPHCEFWQAGNGSRPSWGWRSVIVGRNSIAPYVIWSISNGQKISIREDKWLKSGLIGGPTTRDEPEKVSALIQRGNGMWNETLL